MAKQDRIWRSNHTNALNGFKYFLLQMKDCLMEGGSMSICDPTTATRLLEIFKRLWLFYNFAT